LIPQIKLRDTHWDVADAEVALAIHDDDIPDAPFEAIEKKLIELLQVGAGGPCEESSTAPHAPTPLRASAAASMVAADHSASWLRASEAGGSAECAQPGSTAHWARTQEDALQALKAKLKVVDESRR
jgi:hypothetical protein